MKKIIEVKNLTKTFKSKKRAAGLSASIISFFKPEFIEVVAVNNVSFSIEEGELVGFIGSNGAGKTTTLKMLSGLLYPSEGSVSVMDFEPFTRDKNFLMQISLVMGQKNQLWWDLPAIESFELNKEIYEISDIDYDEILNELVELLDLKEKINIPVRKLSLGERMKCELVAALLHKPKVLFLDEPTIGLDVVMQKKVREFIKSYNEKYKTTIMLTSHYMEDVQSLCERVIIINKGNLIYDGSISELIKNNAKEKIIKVTFNNQTKLKEHLNHGNVESFDEITLITKAERSEVGRIAALLHENYEVDDMDIMEPKLEEIVGKLI